MHPDIKERILTWENEEAIRQVESKSIFYSFTDEISKLCLPHGGLGSLRYRSIQTRLRQLFLAP